MKRTKISFSIKLALLLVLAGPSCNKKATDYRSFLGGAEIVYPGTINSPMVSPGNGRLELSWVPSSDPSVTHYVVYWNNFADSEIVTSAVHQPTDTVKTIINGLAEYNYSFYVNSLDDKGDRSITSIINNAKVYGPIYRGTLHNRLPDASTPFVVNDDNTVKLSFITPDTINIATYITYTDGTGTQAKAVLAPNEDTIVLPSHASGTPVLYQSSYIPVRQAIDTFMTLAADTFPAIFKLVQCDKSLFNEMVLTGDDGIYESDTRISNLWDGSVGPQAYPNIYHSDGIPSLPISISFDMGQVYNNLGVIEETGRNCCHNPSDFEVWGIADITNADPGLASQDGGWKAAMQAKGWTLLTEAFRSDDGSAAMKFNFISNPPPVRYIRIRVNQTVDQSNSVNMSELTFWNKQ